MNQDEKTVHLRLKDNPDITVEEVYKFMEELRKKHPDREIFYDGDLQAVCSRPKKQIPKE
ncbi:MAG: hypothetical protein RXP30_03045 [Thermoplasmata archaeon]|jgi:hypothetical protein|nr:hypothetical protein [Euryarchaeota archaeon]MVT14452.1 hypothetical protein [Euryarchaeota archaeon]MVT36183.1 hypothetical protein [Euryarchaeota archaeon]